MDYYGGAKSANKVYMFSPEVTKSLATKSSPSPTKESDLLYSEKKVK
jgi:hypothetical protein